MWTLYAVRSPHLWHNVVTHAPYTTLAPPGVTHFRDDEKCIRKPRKGNQIPLSRTFFGNRSHTLAHRSLTFRTLGNFCYSETEKVSL